MEAYRVIRSKLFIKDTCKNTYKDTCKNTYKDTCKNTYKDTCKNTHKDTQMEAYRVIRSKLFRWRRQEFEHLACETSTDQRDIRTHTRTHIRAHIRTIPTHIRTHTSTIRHLSIPCDNHVSFVLQSHHATICAFCKYEMHYFVLPAWNALFVFWFCQHELH